MSQMMTREISKGHYRISPTYRRLLGRYPLLPIRNEADYDRADAVVADLFGRDDLSDDEARYLDSLVILIAAYESKHHDLDALAEDISPLQALRSIMASSRTTQADLAKLLGSEAAASMMLSGKREVSKSQAKLLGRRFKVDAGLFI